MASPINKYLSSPGARGRGKWGVARRTLLVSFSQVLAASRTLTCSRMIQESSMTPSQRMRKRGLFLLW